MSYSVEYEPEGLADLESLPKTICLRMINKINWLAENFEQITPQTLTGDFAGFFKLRVGDYRVLYEFNDENKTIIINRVGHRRDIYD